MLAGEAACLEAVDKSAHGVFFDWGLSGKNLFMPLRNIVGHIEPGKRYIVYMYVDAASNRLTGSAKLNPYIRNDEVTVSPGDEVDVLVALRNAVGYRVIINNRHWGMIYSNQIFSPVAIGDRLRGHVIRVTEDNRIDVSLQKQGFGEVQDAAERLLALLREHGGTLSVGDRSAPEAVQRTARMSKKVFKRAVGTLLKQGKIAVEDMSVTLKK